MSLTISPGRRGMDLVAAAQRHFVLRFSAATTAAFVLCEWMGWQPSALAPVLTAVLLASLPVSPPVKLGLGLIAIMGIWAWLAFFLTIWLGQVPLVLFGVIGLFTFVAFAGIAKAKGQLPLTLLLVSFAIVPLGTLTASESTGILPTLLTRAMGLAVVFTWSAYAIWPLPS